MSLKDLEKGKQSADELRANLILLGVVVLVIAIALGYSYFAS